MSWARRSWRPRWLRKVAPPISALVAAQPPPIQERVWATVTGAWAPCTGADGRVRLENQAIWVTGTAPPPGPAAQRPGGGA